MKTTKEYRDFLDNSQELHRLLLRKRFSEKLKEKYVRLCLSDWPHLNDAGKSILLATLPAWLVARLGKKKIILNDVVRIVQFSNAREEHGKSKSKT